MLNLTNIASFRSNITPAAKYLLTGLIVILAASFRPAHPYYIGLTEITINEKPEIQISVRLFTNDLEDALRKSSGKTIDILNPKDKAEADSLLFHYLGKRLSVSLNGKAHTLRYLGYEEEEGSIWTYMTIQASKPSAIKTLSIVNTALYDYFPSQTHIIRINRFNAVSSHKITNPESKADFRF